VKAEEEEESEVKVILMENKLIINLVNLYTRNCDELPESSQRATREFSRSAQRAEHTRN
jgi:hypothetical protein